MHAKVNPKIAFLKLSNDSDLSVFIERYLEYVRVFNKYLYLSDFDEIETLFYGIGFDEGMSALLEEL